MKLAIQLYTLRNHINDGEDLLKILEDVKNMGFDGVEFAGYFGLDAKTIKSKLDELGLVAVGTHIGIDAYKPDAVEATIESCKTLGMSNTGVGWAPHSTIEEARQTAQVLGAANEFAKKSGINVYYHNHTDEFEDIGGVFAIDIIKESVDLELDTYWSFYAGIDNYKFITENSKKIALLHLKDGVDGTPCALGEGQNDIMAVIKAANDVGIEWLVLENDNPVPTGLEDAARSMKYLKANI